LTVIAHYPSPWVRSQFQAWHSREVLQRAVANQILGFEFEMLRADATSVFSFDIYLDEDVLPGILENALHF
jgi:hypothetical protein